MNVSMAPELEKFITETRQSDKYISAEATLRFKFFHERDLVCRGYGHPSRRKYFMSELVDKTCMPCRGGVPPLKGEALTRLQAQLDNWEVVDEHHLEKTYKFPDFRQALDFTVRVGEMAEQQGHHPDIYLAWGRVEIKIWTHKIDGLTESDFILAAKIDQQL